MNITIDIDDPMLPQLLNITLQIRNTMDQIANLPLTQKNLMVKYFYTRMSAESTKVDAEIAREGKP